MSEAQILREIPAVLTGAPAFLVVADRSGRIGLARAPAVAGGPIDVTKGNQISLGEALEQAELIIAGHHRPLSEPQGHRLCALALVACAAKLAEVSQALEQYRAANAALRAEIGGEGDGEFSGEETPQ